MNINKDRKRCYSNSFGSKLLNAASTGAIVGGLLSTGVPALAQTTSTGGKNVLEEMVVTAQKREQTVNEVGMSINALSANQLRMQNIRSVGDLTRVEPSFMVSQATYGTPVYSIRGVGYNSESLAASPTVSVYVDEIPFAYPALTKGATLDIQRVEILKGPQGTLFGQNATGGAINYIAAAPTSTFAAGFEATYARFDAMNINGFLSGPLADTLNARLAFDVSDGGAWQKSYTRGDKLGATRQQKLRLLLDWQPTDELTVNLNLNGWKDRSDTPATQLIALNLQDPQFASFVPDMVNNQLAPHNPRAADWNPNLRHANDETFQQAALRVSFDVSDDTTLTSLSSYEYYDQDNSIGNDGIPQDGNSERQRGTVKSFSQELRANGSALNENLNWLFGLAYARDKTEENINGRLPYTTPAFAFTPLGLPGFTNIYFDSNPTATTKAVFGNLEYYLQDNLSVHAGARYTKSDINYNGCLAGDPVFTAGLNFIQSLVKGAAAVPVAPGECLTFDSTFTPGRVRSSLNENNVSWRVGVDWHPDDRVLLYASVSKGFKAGSYPTLPGTGEIQFRPVKQESVLAYEIGAKAALTSQFEVDAALFHYDYKDKQLRGRIQDPTGVFGVIDALVNIPTSKEDGAELSLRWLPVTGLTLNAAVTYLDARVDGSFKTIDIYATTPTPTEFNGYRFPAAPRWSGSAGAQYEWSLTDNLGAFVGADYRYQTDSPSVFEDKADFTTHPALQVDSYGLLDLHAGVRSENGHWTVQIFGKNVLNKYYWTQENRIYDTSVRYAGMPATYGITVNYRTD